MDLVHVQPEFARRHAAVRAWRRLMGVWSAVCRTVDGAQATAYLISTWKSGSNNGFSLTPSFA